MTFAYYNEYDPFAAAWLRNLIAAGYIADGYVDERSIEDVRPADLAGFTQCHFFAGIGVWSYAARQAGWPDDRPLWTGSCPCQPFSAAGKGGGLSDERHLWPAFHHLIAECRPDVVVGEQVASKDGLAWLDVVHTDMEATGYAFGALDLCAAGVGAPHIRQRTYWLAHSADFGRIGGGRRGLARDGRASTRLKLERFCDVDRLDDDDDTRSQGYAGNDGAARRSGSFGPITATGIFDGLEHDPSDGRQQRWAEPGGRGAIGGRQLVGMAYDESDRHERRGELDKPAGRYGLAHDGAVDRPGPTNGFWRDADWLGCRDDKWRPVEPGTFPLAHGATNRVGRLRGYGNAIVAPLAQAFLECVIEALDPDTL